MRSKVLRDLVGRAADRDRKRDGTAMDFGYSVAVAAYRLGFKAAKKKYSPRRIEIRDFFVNRRNIPAELRRKD